MADQPTPPLAARALALLAGLTELVLPAGCAGCGRSGVAWCTGCAARAGPPRLVAMPAGPSRLPPILAAGGYRGPLRAALLAYKERGRRELITPLAGLLAEALLAAPSAWPRREGSWARAGPCWLVPCPSRAASARVRGGDHVRALAEQVAERLAADGISAGVAGALRMRRGGRDSVGLDAAARRANLRGRVMVRPAELPPPGITVLLVDDVVTTGATLGSCTVALSRAGIEAAGGLVLCDASTLV